MVDIQTSVKYKKLRRDLCVMADSFGSGGAKAIAESIRSLITAIDYDDPHLLRSHAEATLDILTGTLVAFAEGRTKASREALSMCQAARASFEAVDIEPDAGFDELGRELERLTIQGLNSIEAAITVTQWKRFPKQLAIELEAEGEKWREFKANVVDKWPWTDRTIPPTDRELVAQSRAEFARGEGVAIEDLVSQVRGSATTE
jgi:hypothetical protein